MTWAVTAAKNPLSSTRLNRFVAVATGLSRRAADTAITQGRVQVNGQPGELGDQVSGADSVTLDGRELALPQAFTYVIFHKPSGCVTSRSQQGKAPTIYELLPEQYHRLKPVGRLDKDSSGLLLLTDDGELANKLTHPSNRKQKTYSVTLAKGLSAAHQAQIERGVKLNDGTSKLGLSGKGREWTVQMSEGRNRQIRRTFAALGYAVTRLHRTRFGKLELGELEPGKTAEISPQELA